MKVRKLVELILLNRLFAEINFHKLLIGRCQTVLFRGEEIVEE